MDSPSLAFQLVALAAARVEAKGVPRPRNQRRMPGARPFSLDGLEGTWLFSKGPWFVLCFSFFPALDGFFHLKMGPIMALVS